MRNFKAFICGCNPESNFFTKINSPHYRNPVNPLIGIKSPVS